MTYEEYLNALAPQWLRTGQGQAFLTAAGRELEITNTRTKEAALISLVGYADEDALNLLGSDFGLPRIIGEPFEDYRIRLANAWSWNQKAGKESGIQESLENLGFTVNLVKGVDQDGNPTSVFEVWLFINDPGSTTLLARNAVWDSDNWNEGLSGYNSSMVWWLVNRNKAAYEKCEAITLYYGATTPAKDATWDTDNWGSEGRQL